MALTAKQQRFVQEYLIDLNATQAAIRAGYSQKTAQEQSARLLSKVIVQDAITKAQGKLAKRAEITQDSIIEDMRRLAQLAEENGDYNPAIRARELIGKHIGMFSEKLRLSGGLTIAHEIAEEWRSAGNSGNSDE